MNRYRRCRWRHHDVVRKRSDVWSWFGCLDCGVQWNHWGALFSTSETRPLSEDDRLKIVAEINDVELPPLWRWTRHTADGSK